MRKPRQSNRAPQFRHKNRQSGNILLDTIFAIWIVAVIFIPISALLVASRLLNRQAQIQTVATNAAQMEIEVLRSQVFANTAMMTTGTFTIPASVLTAFPSISMGGTYSVSTVSGLGDLSHKVIQIAVKVSWARPDTNGTISTVRLDTYETQGAVP